MTSTLHGNLEVFRSGEQYRAAIEELGIKYDDPRNIDEVMNAKKELYSKLKFQYLEQETKEKFLRLIIDNKPIYIEEKDLQKLEVENLDLKSKLKTQKIENESILRELLDMSSSITEQAQQLETLASSNEDLMSQILQINTQIDELTEQTSDREREFNLEMDDTLITKINEYNNNPDLSANITAANSIPELTQIISDQSEQIEEVNLLVENKAEEVKTIKLQIEEDQRKLIDLDKRKKQLIDTLQSIIQLKESNLSEDADKSELFKLEETGKELSRLLSVWVSLTKHQIEFEEVTNDLIILRIDAIRLSLTVFNDHRLRCFKISKVEGMDVTESFIDSCNYDDDCIGYFVKLRLN